MTVVRKCGFAIYGNFLTASSLLSVLWTFEPKSEAKLKINDQFYKKSTPCIMKINVTRLSHYTGVGTNYRIFKRSLDI